MRNGDGGSVGTDIVECLLNDLLGSWVQCTCRFIEQQNWWVGNDASGDCDSLFLTCSIAY